MHHTTRRTTTAFFAVCAAALALTGCATEATATSAASPPANTSSPSSPTHNSSPSASAPRSTATATATATAPTAEGTDETGSALAQHIHDACSTGADESGVTLTFTADPTGYTTADGRYELVYPFTFDDGHTDPYAIWNCVLSDDTVTSTFLGAGLGDTH
ncbi:hypothetical protein QUG92_15445 [Curtobacterium sp. RHCKG23]|uniref:Uncharacterized protein n=1 Tax=Curtobacterium citri TaxID=3055139 RepID=A0ABT7TAX1_9MICO|nr:hypothetical protein [Curtobacterium citri]MDM7886504.1 hypothetical protein [Curtobacterium citri]